ncbi:MAG: 2-hydroxyacyl-CoA dehydratase [Actinobacteria bacterium]|nr:MAG: 2-hydroxyacyl-CoA dehydratase [Actinomycetota bacterium]
MSMQLVHPYEGLFNRVSGIFAIIPTLPDRLSDEDIEGLARLLPAEMSKSLRAVLEPGMREASLAFFKALGTWVEEAAYAKENGKKVVLMPFNFAPEIIYMFEKAVPVTTEIITTLGTIALDKQGDKYWDFALSMGLPDTLCSASAIEIGSLLTGIDFQPDLILSAAPGSCDANSKIHEFTANYLGLPQIMIEKPADTSRRARELYLTYFKAMLREMEEFLGEELDEDRMREVMEKANRAHELYDEIWEYRKMVPSPVPNIFNAFIYGTKYTVWGQDEGITVMQKLIDTCKRRVETGDYPAPKEIARTYWAYLFYYYDFMEFFNWLEQRGIAIVGDMPSTWFTKRIDTSSKESMIRDLASNSFDYFMTRQIGGKSILLDWCDDITWACRELSANALIYCGHHSCKQTWSVYAQMRNEFMKRTKIPTLLLQGDMWIKRMTPMSSLHQQIDEFINNVVARPRSSRK